MYIKVRTVDGKLEHSLEISKLMTIDDFKAQVAEKFSSKLSLVRLFYRGKQLESGYRICNYELNHHDVVQLLVTPRANKIGNGRVWSDESKDCAESAIDEAKETSQVELVETTSSYYQVGDPVDCIDQDYGAWFEAVILKILSNNTSLIYRCQWTFLTDDEPFDVEESSIRPRARTQLSPADVRSGQRVMINYNTEEPKEDGYWYDLTVEKVKKSRWGVQFVGTLHIGQSQTAIENCKLYPKHEIYAIEQALPIAEQSPSYKNSSDTNEKRRTVAISCKICSDDRARTCRDCGCFICAGKRHPRRIILCDECNKAYHMSCLVPPLETVPDDDWYCPACKRDESQIVKAGDKLKSSKKQVKTELKKGQKDWGRGMGCMGRVKSCTLVPLTHTGPIPGIEVGMSWKYRLQVAEAGVHRPHVAGIHGREDECAYSLVLSGGYEDDVDNGDEFFYTGSGGRDLSGNKRTAPQSSDQALTKMNRALALNCSAQVNDVEGATAENWQSGIPVRVVRSSKMRKHSQGKKYAPEQGFRYDGLYKVVKYFPEKGQSGFIIWRYLLRRDDDTPAPWTPEGRRRIANLGLKMIDYDLANSKENRGQTTLKRPRENEVASEEQFKKQKLLKYQLDDDLVRLIDQDEVNSKLWRECCSYLEQGKIAFVNNVVDRFTCVCCQEIVWKPISTSCSHNICQSCLKRSFHAHVYSCPTCRHPLDRALAAKVNSPLAMALGKIFPGYGVGRM